MIIELNNMDYDLWIRDKKFLQKRG
jgi:hypothetical protein